jgi:hypothetical protein
MTNTRYTLVKQLKQELGSAEQTEILIDYIEELWETVDLLRKRFGAKQAQQIINAPCYATEEYPDNDRYTLENVWGIVLIEPQAEEQPASSEESEKN